MLSSCRRLGLALLGGVVMACGFHPVFPASGVFLAAFAVWMLLWSLQGASPTLGRACGFVWGFAAYGISLSWFSHLFGLKVIALWALLAAFIACFAWGQVWVRRYRLKGWLWVLFTMLNWETWEFIRAELFPLRFPWITPGTAVGPNVLLAWIGVYGVSALLVGLAAGVALRPRWGIVWVGVGGILLSFNLRATSTSDAGEVRVGVVQREEVGLNVYLSESTKFPETPQIVVWPEYALPYDVRLARRDWGLLTQFCQEHHCILIVGTQTMIGHGDDWHNTALTLDGSGVLGEHYKVHTVHFFADGVAGTTAAPVATPVGKIGTPVCFDFDYEDVARHMTAAGAEFLVAPTMDAASWTEREHWQHAELARIRACENGRWMVVAASSGVSCFIDPHGHVHALLEEPLQQGTLAGVVERETSLTFYTRYGWLTPWCLMSGAVVFVLGLLWRGRPPAEMPDKAALPKS